MTPGTMPPAMHHPVTLAQNATLDARAFIYIVLLIVLCIVGFLIIVSVKRRIFDESKEQDQSGATLMESLEHMRQTGQISQSEYEQTRATIIAKTRAMLRDDDAHDSTALKLELFDPDARLRFAAVFQDGGYDVLGKGGGSPYRIPGPTPQIRSGYKCMHCKACLAWSSSVIAPLRSHRGGERWVVGNLVDDFLCGPGAPS